MNFHVTFLFQICTRHIRMILGFSQPQIKQMILAYPKIFTMGKNCIAHMTYKDWMYLTFLT